METVTEETDNNNGDVHDTGDSQGFGNDQTVQA